MPATQDLTREALNALRTRIEAAEYLGLKPQTLAVWACRQEGPAYVKVGRSVRYRQIDLDDWLERQTVRPGQD